MTNIDFRNQNLEVCTSLNRVENPDQMFNLKKAFPHGKAFLYLEIHETIRMANHPQFHLQMFLHCLFLLHPLLNLSQVRQRFVGVRQKTKRLMS